MPDIAASANRVLAVGAARGYRTREEMLAAGGQAIIGHPRQVVVLLDNGAPAG